MKSAKFQRALQRRKARARKRGIALIMVLGAITILTVFLTELQTDTSAAVAGALAERDRLRAEYYARSAVNLSRLLLASEKTVIRGDPVISILLGTMFGNKTPQLPVWEFSDMVLGAFNGGDRATVFGSRVGVDISTAKNVGLPGNGYFNIAIIDEDSKINVNSAAAAVNPQQLVLQMQTLFAGPEKAPMFEQRDGDDQFTDAATMCAEFIDWADPDENLANCLDATKPASGAEDNIYQALGLPYRRKNSPYDSLEELRQLRGMDETRWANLVEPDPNDAHKRLITVWGQDSSAINVNTADAENLWTSACSVATLDSAVCIDPLQRAAFIQVFKLLRTMTRGIPFFGTYRQFRQALEGKGQIGPILAALGVQPMKVDTSRFKARDLRRLWKTESKLFSIYAEGVLPGSQREARVKIHAVIDMNKATDWKQALSNADPNAALNSTAAQPQSEAAEAAADDAEFQQEIITNPFGQIVYYRVD